MPHASPGPSGWRTYDEENPNVTPELVGTLSDPAWVKAGQPLCLSGDCGTGKSPLLIGIGTAMAEAGAWGDAHIVETGTEFYRFHPDPAQAAPQLPLASMLGKAVSHSLRLRPQVIARWENRVRDDRIWRL